MRLILDDSAPSLKAVSRDKKSATMRQADGPTNFNPILPQQKICSSTTKKSASVRRPLGREEIGTRRGRDRVCQVSRTSIPYHNRPFAASGHMVQNPPCWRASLLLLPHWDIQNKENSNLTG